MAGSMGLARVSDSLRGIGIVLRLAAYRETRYGATDPTGAWLNADCNGDGNVTFADIDPFVALLGTTCP
jgi:hypothetical protein